MTGIELKKLWEQAVDVAYSGYWDSFRLQRAFNKGFFNVIQKIYNTRLTNQNAFDEISYLIATSQVFSVNSTTNTLYLGTHTIPLISLFPSANLVTATSSIPHDLITGTRVQFSNITGTGTITTLVNQTFVVTVVNSVTFTVATTTTLTGSATAATLSFPDSILDYYHYLWAQAKFTQLTDFTVVKSTKGTPIKITFNTRPYFRDKDQIVISGIGGNTNANGTFYLSQANEFDYFLYSDENLRTPVAGNGIQTGTGIVSEVFVSELKFKRSDEKGNLYGKPTVQSPYFQQSKNLIRILPSDPCSQITMDYMRKPPQVIDITDNTIDLTNFYIEPLQYQVVAEVARIFASSDRDTLLLQTETIAQSENP